jgi:hypothetical protein
MQRLTLQDPSLKIALERFVGAQKRRTRNIPSDGSASRGDAARSATPHPFGAEPPASEPIVQGG